MDAATADYPRGRIRNSGVGITGTGVQEELYGDIIQLFQKLKIDANITENGLPDNVTNGYQLLTALNNNTQTLGDARYFRNTGGTIVGDLALLTSTTIGSRYFRLRENSSNFMGGFLMYDGSPNTFNIGVHEGSNSDISDDINSISIARASGNISFLKQTAIINNDFFFANLNRVNSFRFVDNQDGVGGTFRGFFFKHDSVQDILFFGSHQAASNLTSDDVNVFSIRRSDGRLDFFQDANFNNSNLSGINMLTSSGVVVNGDINLPGTNDSRYIRFTESNSFLGAYIHYNGAENVNALDFGVHRSIDSNPSNDLIYIRLRRGFDFIDFFRNIDMNDNDIIAVNNITTEGANINGTLQVARHSTFTSRPVIFNMQGNNELEHFRFKDGESESLSRGCYFKYDGISSNVFSFGVNNSSTDTTFSQDVDTFSIDRDTNIMRIHRPVDVEASFDFVGTSRTIRFVNIPTNNQGFYIRHSVDRLRLGRHDRDANDPNDDMDVITIDSNGNIDFNSGDFSNVDSLSCSSLSVGGTTFTPPRTVNIGTWNMLTTGTVDIFVPNTSVGNVRGIQVMIVDDTGIQALDLAQGGNWAIVPSSSQTDLQVRLTRNSGAPFQSSSFDDTNINRGYVVVHVA